MAGVQPRAPQGFRDYLPETMIPKDGMLRRIAEVFERFGFSPIMTPAVEYAEILRGKCGEEGDHLMYNFLTRGGKEVCLRYDLTVPLARVIAQYREIVLPFRRYQIAPVWRAERPQRGRFREFLQCDADIVGPIGLLADSECIQVGCAVLDALGIDGYSLRVNNRKLLSGILEAAGVRGAVREVAALRVIDKMSKVDRDEVLGMMEREVGLAGQAAEDLLGVIGAGGPPEEVLRTVEDRIPSDSAGRAGVEEICEVFRMLEAAGVAEKVHLDLGIARGLDYYTGTVYEGTLDRLPGVGSILAGGRYDSLIGVFRGEEIPGVGISVGVDRLFAALVELGLVESRSTTAGVLITCFDRERTQDSLRLAGDLRHSGINCEVFPGLEKLSKQFRYADRKGIRWVVVVGPDEVSRGEVKVKDLRDGSERSVSPVDLAGVIASGAAG